MAISNLLRVFFFWFFSYLVSTLVKCGDIDIFQICLNVINNLYMFIDVSNLLSFHFFGPFHVVSTSVLCMCEREQLCV